MNILYICASDPNKASFGYEQRTHYFYEALKSIGNVYVACLGVEWPPKDIGVPVIAFYPQSGLRRVINAFWLRLFKKFFPSLPLYWLPFGLKSNVEQLFPDVKFDVVVKRLAYGLGFAHLWKIAPLYLDVDDYLMEVFKTRFLNRGKYFSDGIACFIQRFFLRRVERNAAGGWVSNPQQASLVRLQSSAGIVENIPPLPPLGYDPTSSVRDLIFTVGLMDYKPNYEGVDVFLREVWPEVHKRFPLLEYHVVGKNAPGDYAARWQLVPGVKVRGFVADLSELYQRAVASVVPITQGGGTCIKTRESLAYSRVCLATEFGLRGLNEDDIVAAKGALCRYEDADSFCAALGRLIEEVDYRSRCEENGRIFVANRYSFARFKSAVGDVLGRKPHTR